MPYARRSLLQYALCLLGALLSGVLLVLDLAHQPLPCLGAGTASLSPCAQMKAQLAAWFPLPPAALGLAGFCFATLLLGWRAGTGLPTSLWLRRSLQTVWLIGTTWVLFLLTWQIMHRAFCPWCLATAAVFLIAAALDFRLPRAIGPLSPVTLFILFQLFTFSALGLIAFVLPAATPAGFQQRLTQTLPALIDPSVLEEIGPCGFATNAPPLPNFRSVRAPLAQGHPAAPNHVLVFFDPFCPLCRVLDRNLEEVLRNAAGSVRVVTVPVAHLAGSDDAVRLLFAASHQPGGGELTSRLVALLFTLQDQSHPPASREQWSVLLTKAGLPAAALLRELDSPAVTRAMQEARNAFEAAGATVTPCVLINGRPVTSSASSIRSGCLSRLITETSSRRVAE